MTYVVGNPNAASNEGHGRRIYDLGIRDPEEVLLAHLWWNRGSCADFWFANGYRDAALADGLMSNDAINAALAAFAYDANDWRHTLWKRSTSTWLRRTG
jgi:hypothetical protein